MRESDQCQRLINRLTVMHKDVNDLLPLIAQRFHGRLRAQHGLYGKLIVGLERQRDTGSCKKKR